MDTVSRETRSRIMSSISSSRNRSTELRLRAHLIKSAISGWKLRPTQIQGKPDFVFPKARLAVFVDGCFWHSCPSCGRPPHSNLEYWDEKLMRNKQRDKMISKQLRRDGWRVLRVWEHSVLERPELLVARIRQMLGPQKTKRTQTKAKR